jgi:hypothetical protein
MAQARRIGAPRGGSGLAPFGMPQKLRSSKLYALSGFNAANYYATQSGGGEAGVNTGFGNVTMFRVRSLVAATQYVRSRLATGPSRGWQHAIDSTYKLGSSYGNGTTFIDGARFQLVPSDVGKIFVLATLIDGAQQRTICNRLVMSTVAQTAYSPVAAATLLGTGFAAGSNPASGVDFLASLDFTGAPTDAQLLALLDAIRATGDVPINFAGATVTHRCSLKEQLAKAGGVVVDGQAAPAQIDDTITAASIDALAKVGTPVVKVIDPSIDGRVIKGVLGFSAAAALEAANGIRLSTSGGWVGVHFRLDRNPADAGVSRFLAGSTQDANAGWGFYTYSGVLYLFAYSSGGTFVNVCSYTFTAADYGQPHAVAARFNGTSWRIVWDGVVQGSESTSSFRVAATVPMRLGNQYPGVSPFDQGSVWGAAGHNTAIPTDTELSKWCTDTLANASTATIAGKTQARWDLTQDIAANGGELPAQVLDRVGTDHLTRVDIDTPKTGPNGVRGAGPYAATDAWQTAPGGGIQGANAGFHVVVDFVLNSLTASTAGEGIVACAVGTTGWKIHVVVISGSVYVRGVIQNVAFSNAVQVTTGMLNTRLRAVLNKTATVVQLSLNGVSAADAAAATYNQPSNAAMAVSEIGNPLASGYVEAVQGGNFALTSGEIATIHADRTAPPPVIAGKTLKRWRFEDDIASAATGKVPRTSAERIAGGDDLTRIGAGLQVAQRVDRLFSYETSPIVYGGRVFSIADYWSHATAMRGLATGFTFGLYWTLDSIIAASATRVLASCFRNTPNAGWLMYTSGTNNTLSVSMANAAGSAISAPAATLLAADVGKKLLTLMVWDGTRFRLYLRRVEQGTGTATTGFSPSNNPVCIGRDPRAGSELPVVDGCTIHGWFYAATAWTLPQVQAAHDIVLATDDIGALSGFTDTLVSLTQDAKGNGGAFPAQAQDRIGGNHFTKNGNPTLRGDYARALGW